MIDISKLIPDAFSRQARLYPALLCILPSLVLFFAFFPELLTASISNAVVAVASSFGVLYAMASFARSKGKRTEKRLLKLWGAWPTTIWLRHQGGFVPPQTIARYHQYLGRHVPGLALPTAEAESIDAAAADTSYASAIEWLKEKCRGKNYALVEKENISYGFRRNMRGLRSTALFLCLAEVVISVLSLEFFAGWSASLSDFFTQEHLTVLRAYPLVIGATIFNILTAIAWLGVVTDSWVREAADEYARALLANCEDTTPKMARAKKKAAVASQISEV